MHPNVKKGTQIHRDHFEAIRNPETSHLGPGWEVWSVDEKIKNVLLGTTSTSRFRPDWILVNPTRKLALIIDITARYQPRHYRKGLKYQSELQRMLNDPAYTVVYTEDYWLNAIYH